MISEGNVYFVLQLNVLRFIVINYNIMLSTHDYYAIVV